MKPALVEAASLAFPTRSIFLTIRGKPIAGNRHDGFEAAGAGNQFTVWLVRHSQRKRGATDRLNLRSTAPVLDPTNAPYTPVASWVKAAHHSISCNTSADSKCQVLALAHPIPNYYTRAISARARQAWYRPWIP